MLALLTGGGTASAMALTHRGFMGNSYNNSMMCGPQRYQGMMGGQQECQEMMGWYPQNPAQ